MEAHPAALKAPSADRLTTLAMKCLREPASRRLDGEIYCAVQGIRDLNEISDLATQDGLVLVEPHCGAEIEWIEVPPFTEVLKHAETLLPADVTTICRDARRVCATALRVRALVNTPPPLEFCQR
jgi:hypothetical protein